MALNDLSPEELVEISQMNIVGNGLFYSKFLEKVRYDDSNPTETAYTDGKEIVIGPYAIDNIENLAQLNFIMAHEALHIVLGHCTKEIRLESDNHTVMNIVTDIIINTILSNPITKEHYGLADVKIEKVKFGLLPNIDFSKCSWQDLYKQAISQVNKASSGQKIKIKLTNDKGETWETQPMIIQDKGYTLSKSGQADNDAKELGASSGSGQKQEGQQDGQQANLEGIFFPNVDNTITENDLTEALNESLMLCQTFGANPGSMLEELKARYSKYVDWRLVLKQKIKRFINKRISTYERPKRTLMHTGIILPDTSKQKFREKDTPPIRIFWDTSGSLYGMAEHILSEVNNLCNSFDVNGQIYFWDTRLNKEHIPLEDYNKSKTKFELKGGGGTCVDSVIKFINESKREKVINIIITDGFFSPQNITNETKEELIWIILYYGKQQSGQKRFFENMVKNKGKHFVIGIDTEQYHKR